MSEHNLVIQGLADQLEPMLDRSCLITFLEALSMICREKAEHLRSNWQDLASAKCWDQTADAIDRVIRKLCV